MGNRFILIIGYNTADLQQLALFCLLPGNGQVKNDNKNQYIYEPLQFSVFIVRRIYPVKRICKISNIERNSKTFN